MNFCPVFRADSSPHWLEALAPRVPDLQPLYSLLRPLVTQDYRLGADTSRRAFLGHTLSFGCIPPPPPASSPSLPPSQERKPSASSPSPWGLHSPAGRGPAGLSMPFCWGWVGDCSTQLLAETGAARAMDTGPAPPCHLIAHTTFLLSSATLSHACSWHFNKTQLGSVS